MGSQNKTYLSAPEFCVLDENGTCSIFIQLDAKSRRFFYFPALDPAKYFYRMATTAGPSCSEVGMKCSKQELSCFVGVRHELIGWKNWIV